MISIAKTTFKGLLLYEVCLAVAHRMIELYYITQIFWSLCASV